MDSSPTILVVDEDPVSSSLLSEQLLAAGYHPIAAPDLKTAQLVLEVSEPDLLLLDLPLPDLSAATFARRLHSDNTTSPLPVVALSAEPLPKDFLNDQDDNFAAYALHSTSPAEILSTIDGVLRDHSDPL